MDYLHALERPEIRFELGGKTYTTRKASLRLFFELQQALVGPDEESVPRYLSLAFAVPVEEVTTWGAVEALNAFVEVQALNRPEPIHMDFARQDKQDRSFDYNHRALAIIVTRIAQGFGWDRDYILDQLTYDEARCYLQEMLLDKHAEREYLYSLSEMGITYDSAGKGTRAPFPPPPIPSTIKGNPWVAEPAPVAAPVRKQLGMPGAVVGIVIDLEEEAQKYERR